MGRRNWQGKAALSASNAQAAERVAVYGNRRRIRGRRGKLLMRKRAEKVERSFAHCYGTGGMRRTHLRGHPKILKRLLIHASAFNLGLLMRKLFGLGTPRSLAERLAGLSAGIWGLLWRLRRLLRAIGRPERPFGSAWPGRPPTPAMSLAA
ncbi:MAG: transposase [Planctomycetes bacterium]|nr:transposase [Planctomycetota bacterium]